MKALQTQFTIPGRTVHNLSHVVKFDARPGVIYPLTHIPMLPVDRIEAELRSLVLTFPTKSPLMSNFMARIYAFYVPYSLYVPEIKANSRLTPSIDTVNTDAGAVGGVENTVLYSGDNWVNVPFPYYEPVVSNLNSKVKPHCLWEFLGVPVGFNFGDFATGSGQGSMNPLPYVNAMRLLIYYDVFRNYFANSMELTYPAYKGTGSQTDNITAWSIRDFSELENYFEGRKWYRAGSTNRNVYFAGAPFYGAWTNNYSSYSGMLVKTFTKDMNNVFLSDGRYSSAIARSVLDVSSGTLDLNQLAVGERLYEYFSKVAATGGRFDEFARAEWGVDLRGSLDIPMFLRSWSFDIGFDTVVSNASTDTRELGSLAGRGVGGLKKKGKRDRSCHMAFSSKEYGELVFYMTIEPKNDYYQGIDPFLVKNYLGDLHTPSLDRIGWQPLYLAQLNALNTAGRKTEGVGWDVDSNPFQIVVGHQPAWTEYKSMVNRLHGDLANSSSSLHNWVLARDYENDSFDTDSVDSYISYIDPASYVDAFADTSTASDPFVVQVAFDITAKRPVSNSNIHVF